MPKIVIDMEAGPDMAQLLAALAQAHGVNKFEVDYGNPKPRPITQKKPLLRDVVMQQFALARTQKTGAPRYSATELVLMALEDGSPHHLNSIRKVFDAHGRSTGGVDGAVFTLAKDGKVKRLGTGVYQLVSVPELEAPKKREFRGRHTGSSEEALLAALADGEPHHAGDLRQSLVENGFSLNTLDSRIQKSMKEGQIERVGPATYRLTRKKEIYDKHDKHAKQPEAQDPT